MSIGELSKMNPLKLLRHLFSLRLKFVIGEEVWRQDLTRFYVICFYRRIGPADSAEQAEMTELDDAQMENEVQSS